MADSSHILSKSGITKIIALLCLMLAMALYFSGHVLEEEIKYKTYFVTSMIVSPFLHTSFLLIAYVFGAKVIQKTLLEVMVNPFYTLMLITAAIIQFALPDIHTDPGTIASGALLICAATCYGFDTYFALATTIALNDNSNSSGNATTAGATTRSYPQPGSYPPTTGGAGSYPPYPPVSSGVGAYPPPSYSTGSSQPETGGAGSTPVTDMPR